MTVTYRYTMAQDMIGCLGQAKVSTGAQVHKVASFGFGYHCFDTLKMVEEVGPEVKFIRNVSFDNVLIRD